ncbi:hypothetical protein COLU111180_10015 [Cohnella lubricantis]|uniref:Uncharacterized protein n=1 Tax=Cohnella lubricantis TaxID=2163172 RepID=A0A841TBG4_9BACL|nr:hypothetical protein [Cohnella lubricantis]MBB6678352.1 hypothetical protein [Cohnella lubricantis]MBP2116732.1 rubrerythrin [Cohnella lubricantis]
MAVIVCPWCQSELPVEEGQEPERYCPICDNEIGGYRSLQIGLDRNEELEEDAEARAELDEDEVEDLSGLADWDEDKDLREKSESLLVYEEAVEKLLDEQETVPECPHCREYMLEAGNRVVDADSFLSRESDMLGGPVLKAPFAMTMYICPSCFSMQYTLAEENRTEFAQRLSGAGAEQKKGR